MHPVLRGISLIVRWPLSVFLLFLGAISVFTGDILAGIGIGLVGGALLPILRQVGKFPLTPWIRGGIVAAGFIIFGAGVPKKHEAIPNQPEPPAAEATIAISSTSSASELTEPENSARVPQAITVTAITDGDTIKVQLADGTMEKVRIIGIDAPETSPMECFAKEATARLSSLTDGKQVTLETQTGDDRDAFGRLLRYILLDDEDVSAILIREGYVYSYEKYPHPRLAAYEALEADAKQQRKGLWSTCQTSQGTTASKAPASVAAPTAVPTPTPTPEPTQPPPVEGECIIKGNVNSDGEKIYHFPGCRSYSQTKIKPEEGDHWFCTEAQAQAAGFRRAGNCP